MSEETHICVYGCGRVATHQFSNGKWCCEVNQSMCPTNRKKNELPKIRKVKREKPELCDYGCGQEAKFYLKTVNKWCCSKSHSSCPILIKNCLKNKKNLLNIVKREKPELCDYGCGQEAKYYFKTTNKWCCSKKQTSCKTHRINKSKKMRKKLVDYKQKHPKLFELEEVQEVDGILEVRCKFCKKWFVPSYDKLRARIYCIENKVGNANCYFFCSMDCRKKSPDTLWGHKRKDPIAVKNYETYHDEVWRLTNITIKKHKIKDIEFRGRKFKKSLDHKVSITAGFKNNINPKIIANKNNLEIIDERENNVKKTRCSITIDELLNNYIETH